MRHSNLKWAQCGFVAHFIQKLECFPVTYQTVLNKRKQNRRKTTKRRIKTKKRIKREGNGIRWRESECCLYWLTNRIAVPCVCVGCALNSRQLINPALFHSPQALSTVSAALHNHLAQGWEVPPGRATLALGTRPPHTSLQVCLKLDMPQGDEKLALSRLPLSLQGSWLFI